MRFGTVDPRSIQPRTGSTESVLERPLESSVWVHVAEGTNRLAINAILHVIVWCWQNRAEGKPIMHLNANTLSKTRSIRHMGVLIAMLLACLGSLLFTSQAQAGRIKEVAAV